MNANSIYTAAMRAGSFDELLEILVAVDTLQAAGAIPDAEYFPLRARLSLLYWSDYHGRVMAEAVAD